MTYKTILFHGEHLNLMDIRQQEKDAILSVDRVKKALYRIEGNADAITLIHNGRIIACMGYSIILPGVAEVWLIPSIYVKEVPVLFFKEVKTWIESLAKTLKWHRVQTLTLTDPFHRSWMEHLGFVEEGTMKNYFQGRDYIMSARYFNEN